MRFRQLAWVPITIALSVSTAGAGPVLLNGGFESPDLSAWSVGVEMAWRAPDDSAIGVGDLPFSFFDAFPSMAPSVLPVGHYTPVEGAGYLEIPGNPGIRGFGDYSTEGAGTISVSQNLALRAGDIVSGWAALFTRDYFPYDRDTGFVTIARTGVSGTPLAVSVSGAYGAHWGAPESKIGPGKSPWLFWSWVAPSSGTYRLSLNNRMDDQEDSVAAFDGIRVKQVPEPSTMLLLGTSMAFAGMLRLRNATRQGRSRQR